jgi:aerobic carbon-monoxide dehydrogenase medium subunit
MKPAPFDYARPSTLADTIALLKRDDLWVKLLAGGQSLGSMLNLRLAQPDLLVDITAVPDLLRVETEDDGLLIGACVTHADIEDGRVPDPTDGALPAVARAIAYRAVRNRGTIGGSLVHADPAADWISALAALGADAVVRGPAGQRRLPVEQFMAGAFEAALEPDELLEAIRVPRLSPRRRWGFYKFCRKAGEFAQAIGSVLYDPERAVCRVVIGATDSTPIVVPDATPLFGGRPEDGLALAFDSSYAAKLLDNKGMRDPFERQIHLVALKRAVHLASRP